MRTMEAPFHTRPRAGLLRFESIPTPSAIDVNADLPNFLEFFWLRASTGANLRLPTKMISNPTLTNIVAGVAGGTWPTISATNWLNANNDAVVGTFSAANAQQYAQNVGATQYYVEFSVPCTRVTRRALIGWGGKRVDASSHQGVCTADISLTDGSAAAISATSATPSGNNITAQSFGIIHFRSPNNAATTMKIRFRAAQGDTVADTMAIQCVGLWQ